MSLTPTEAVEVADIHNPILNRFWSRPQADIEADLADIRSRPVTKFAEMPRDEEIVDPVTLSLLGPGAFAVTRHADILEMSRHPEIWSSANGITVMDTPPEFNEFFGSMISMDDPRHGRLRRLIAAGFTPRMLAMLEDSVTEQARQIIDNVCERGEVDFVVDVAAQLPLKIVCDLMGIPDSELEFCFNQSNIILGIGDPEYAPPDGTDPLTALLTAGGALANLMQEIAETKRGADTDDLTTLLVNAEIEGEKLSHADIASFFVLLVVAGNETTRNAISWGLTHLTANPDQRELWRADFEGLSHSAVEEIVRLASPVTYMRRTATQDTEIAGQPVAAGEKALMFYLAANRDEAIFEDPYRFDIRRDPNPHVGFGGPGPHFCLGAHLARREIKVMYRELFERLPDIEATSEPDVLASSFIHGVKHLKAEFTPTSPR
ncbi:MAG: cytochrome P450 [Acidimicrobiales bacterium]